MVAQIWMDAFDDWDKNIFHGVFLRNQNMRSFDNNITKSGIWNRNF